MATTTKGHRTGDDLVREINERLDEIQAQLARLAVRIRALDEPPEGAEGGDLA